MNALYLATYESRNFTFEGVGENEAQAVDVLIQGLRAHASEYGLPVSWWYEYRQEAAIMRGEPESLVEDPKRLIDDGLFTVRRLERGQAYRDREEI